MLFDVVHYFSLLVTNVKCTSCPVARRGEISISAFFYRRVNVIDTLIEDESSLSAHQLKHQHQKKNLGIDFSILSLDNPPHFLIIHVKQLLHQLLMPLKSQLEACVEVGSHVEQLRDIVSPWREEQIF